MKPIKWVLIVISATIIPLILVIVITRFILNPQKTWWWALGILILYLIIGLIVGVIFLIKKFKKKPKEKEEIDFDKIEKNAINRLKYDDENPDNFIRKDRIIVREGQSGTERTTMIWLVGSGTETGSKIDILINIKNPEKEIIFLINKTEEYVKEKIRTFAENPEMVEPEERILTTDEYGRPATIIKSKRMTITEKKEQEQKEEAEEKQAY